VTLPAFRQEVQTFSRLGARPISARTDWMLGFHRRDVRRWECEMLLPKPGPLPQTSQVAATVTPWVIGADPGGPPRATAMRSSPMRVAETGGPAQTGRPDPSAPGDTVT